MPCFSACTKPVDVEKKIEEVFEKKFIPTIEKIIVKYLDERVPEIVLEEKDLKE
jgi:hypothetical protein